MACNNIKRWINLKGVQPEGLFVSYGHCSVVLTMPYAVVQAIKLPDCIPGVLVSLSSFSIF